MVVESRFGIIDPFDIRAEEAGELDVPTCRSELGIDSGDRRSDESQSRVGHLRGHRPHPDHGIEPSTLSGQSEFIRRLHLLASGTNRLVGLLSTFCFRRELTRCRAEIIGSVLFADATSRCLDRLSGKVDAIGSHVGDVAVFVQPLSDLHRLLRREAEFAVRLLL